MITQTKIICPHCHSDTGLISENFSHYVMTHDIKCPKCGEILIRHNPVMC